MVPVLELITVYCCGLLVKILSLGMQTFFICFSFVCVVNKKSLFLKQEREQNLYHGLLAVVVMVPVFELITIYCCGLLVMIPSLGMHRFFLVFHLFLFSCILLNCFQVKAVVYSLHCKHQFYSHDCMVYFAVPQTSVCPHRCQRHLQ